MGQKVLAGVSDLFFQAKIAETAKHLGVDLAFARSFDQVMERVAAEPPALLILDLNADPCRPLEVVARLKADPALQGVPVLAYLSHVQAELKRQAEAAGCDRILPRSAFSANLPEILKPYAGMRA
jgi:CheY-like chemotaxis protein